MNTQSRISSNNIYILKDGLNQQELWSAINRCLCQAEALSIIATIIDAETIGVDTLNDYLWTLSDIVRETRCLYENLISRY